jgi:hypothetical protein
VDEPVDPLVPELLLVPALPPEPDGTLEVELPDAPMPEVVPELELPPLDGDDELVADGPSEPLAEPPVDPMPDAVPDADPEAVVPQADSAVAAASIRAMVNLFIAYSFRCRTSPADPQHAATSSHGRVSHPPQCPSEDARGGRRTVSTPPYRRLTDAAYSTSRRRSDGAAARPRTGSAA